MVVGVAADNAFDGRTERGVVVVGADGFVTEIATVVVVTPPAAVNEAVVGVVEVGAVTAATTTVVVVVVPAAMVDDVEDGIVDVEVVAVSATTLKLSAVLEEIPANAFDALSRNAPASTST